MPYYRYLARLVYDSELLSTIDKEKLLSSKNGEVIKESILYRYSDTSTYGYYASKRRTRTSYKYISIVTLSYLLRILIVSRFLTR